MNEQTISVVIADRSYRLTIQGDQEAFIREAAKSINMKVKTYAEQYAYRDRQDLLAMVALQLASEGLMKDDSGQADHDQLKVRLNELNMLLDITV
ncbi:MAG: hypothetical protein A2X11_02435 [Bacteroidetes bacterium GWE2_42_24]|nr:MAG: hypothetical protein A2X11_02435 [Bacteroidetes bacterium GWE2_42_24]OFY25395.1 MAG: hypothetical protein A2X09_02880 [Bacteroidetes bacterium GWF2_43_11]PKP23706.1 MAG: cell division protein ZapA [Bacteroidetes bacterium HGW-Bacteroidetes-22]